MFCPNCGTEILKDALFCGNCGLKVTDFVIPEAAPAEEIPAEPVISFEAAAEDVDSPETPEPAAQPVFQTTQPAVIQEQTCREDFRAQNQFNNFDDKSTLIIVIKVFLIIGTVINALTLWLIPLAWCLPMTLSIFKSFKTGRPIGMGMKICTLLFVNLIAGICLLCLKDDRR